MPNEEVTETLPTNDVITWTASEYIAHEKSFGWYAGLGVGALVIAALALWLTRDIVSSLVIIVATLLLGVYGSKQPRQLPYQLDAHGFSIGEKHYRYEAFRSFAVVPDGAFSSLVFMPLKRFSLLTTLYYDPKDEDRILAVLVSCLPAEEYRRDIVDNLLRRIRF